MCVSLCLPLYIVCVVCGLAGLPKQGNDQHATRPRKIAPNFWPKKPRRDRTCKANTRAAKSKTSALHVCTSTDPAPGHPGHRPRLTWERHLHKLMDINLG